MKTILFFFIVCLRPLSASTIFLCDADALDQETKSQLFERVLKEEPLRAFSTPSFPDLKGECQWIPPTLWQIAALHAFFNDTQAHEGVLRCQGNLYWDPVSYDESIQAFLPLAHNHEALLKHFDELTQTIPDLCSLFWTLNSKIAELYRQALGAEEEMLRLALDGLPPFEEWPERGFPFWNSPWIYSNDSAQLFYDALSDRSLISAIVEIEQRAHAKGEWVLYRGYDGMGFPTTLEEGGEESHALSFGSTLLGGAFFSLESSALAYAKSKTYPHRFLALSVTPRELQQVFRVGPLHPFVQLLADGEMFHAHTKIAAPHAHGSTNLPGYFMRCNKCCNDPIGYVLTFDLTPEELERAFLSLCKKSGYVFFD